MKSISYMFKVCWSVVSNRSSEEGDTGEASSIEDEWLDRGDVSEVRPETGVIADLSALTLTPGWIIQEQDDEDQEDQGDDWSDPETPPPVWWEATNKESESSTKWNRNVKYTIGKWSLLLIEQVSYDSGSYHSEGWFSWYCWY